MAVRRLPEYARNIVNSQIKWKNPIGASAISF
jgi:hypothetical protein